MNKDLENFLSLAKIMSEEDVINQLKYDAEMHSVIMSDDTKSKLLFSCQLFVLKYDIEKRGLKNVIQSAEEISSLSNQINNLSKQ